MPKLSRSECARLAGMRAWEVSRDVKLIASARGGSTTLERYGRSHMLAMAFRRKQYGCEGGIARGDEQGKAKCPSCGKRAAVSGRGRVRLHVRLGAPPMLRVV